LDEGFDGTIVGVEGWVFVLLWKVRWWMVVRVVMVGGMG
jgi:hypothetical protein